MLRYDFINRSGLSARMMFVPSPTYSLVLHVDGSHVSDLWHVGVVEGHIEEDCGPEDAGKDEQDHGQSN